MQDAILNSGTPIFKIRILLWHNLWVMTFWNNPRSHAKHFYFKSQTHIEHSSAEMNTTSAWDSLLLDKVSKITHHPMQIIVRWILIIYDLWNIIFKNTIYSTIPCPAELGFILFWKKLLPRLSRLWQRHLIRIYIVFHFTLIEIILTTGMV